MGVIKKSDPKLGVFTSSEESLNIPEPSDDENANSNNEGSETLPSHLPRRAHNRVPSVPMTFCTQRKHAGKRRSRRFENVNQLMTLVEDEELGEVSIYDFLPRSSDAFQRLLDNEESLEAWYNFIQSSEEVQNRIIKGKEYCSNSKNVCISKHRGTHLTGEQAFQNIKTGLRNVLKKRVPLRMLEGLEKEVVDFFTEMPHETYISPSLPSFQRLLLHGVSQYHCLNSHSFGCGHARAVKVLNPYELFETPEVLLFKYLEERQKML